MLEHMRLFIGSLFLFIQNLIKFPNIESSIYNAVNEISNRIQTINRVENDEQESKLIIDKTIMSYNIHGGFDCVYNFRLDKMLDFLFINKCGILCLQEVTGEEQFNYIKSKLNYNYSYFSENNAIFTNFEIISSNNVKLNNFYLYKQNSFMHTLLKINNIELSVINIHLTSDITGFKQKNEKTEIVNYIETHNLDNVLIIGDTNCIDSFDKNDMLLKYTKHSLGSTYPSPYPFMALDKLYSKHVDIIEGKLFDFKDLSDHLAVKYVFKC
jgi:endonuclease/exonuclease/phosphatase family metal-dependent hydrolase|tara:strand:+ start:197 stop:1003 length:807 start_codon:yes stop_codon:yes gene_type:complete